MIFVRNTTEAINLVRHAWLRKNLRKGEGVLSTVMEHHSNLVPWLMAREELGAKLDFVGLAKGDRGKLDLGAFGEKLGKKTRLVAVTQASNTLGTRNPVGELTQQAHENGATVLVDGAQAVPHEGVDVRELGCDFYAFSGHKMLAPLGIGVLWAREELLDGMEPFLGGGDMIREVTLTGARWNEPPYKFEAGTPNVEGAVGLGAAIEYLDRLGMDRVRAHERDLTAYALERLGEVDALEVYGPRKAEERAGLVSFNLGDVHSHDLAGMLDEECGVAIRSGHHCTMPLHEQLGISASARASFYVYNTREDVDALCDGLERARSIFELK